MKLDTADAAFSVPGRPRATRDQPSVSAPAATFARAAATMRLYFACIRNHSVCSSRTCASFSSADVITPFSYDTCAIATLSRASSSAFCCVRHDFVGGFKRRPRRFELETRRIGRGVQAVFGLLDLRLRDAASAPTAAGVAKSGTRSATPNV